MQDALNTTNDELIKRDDSFQDAIATMWEEMMEFASMKNQLAEFIGMWAEIEGIKRELNHVWRMRFEGRGAFQHDPRLDAPQSDKFKGSRVAYDVDNFLCSIKDYSKQRE